MFGLLLVLFVYRHDTNLRKGARLCMWGYRVNFLALRFCIHTQLCISTYTMHVYCGSVTAAYMCVYRGGKIPHCG